MENKDLDRLTRRLMEGTAERPSASLNTRIMALIRQQQAAKIAFVPYRCILQVSGWIGKEIKKCGNRKKVSNKRLISYQQFTKVINNATIVSE